MSNLENQVVLSKEGEITLLELQKDFYSMQLSISRKHNEAEFERRVAAEAGYKRHVDICNGVAGLSAIVNLAMLALIIMLMRIL